MKTRQAFVFKEDINLFEEIRYKLYFIVCVTYVYTVCTYLYSSSKKAKDKYPSLGLTSRKTLVLD